MNFFDSLFQDLDQLLEGKERKTYPLDSSWQDLEKNQLIMQRDTAFELDGIGFNLVTSKDIGDSCIEVIGNDLTQLNSDTKFARISLIQIEDQEDEQESYNAIRKIEYAKYHYSPKGFMPRTSSDTHSEIVRISKEAVAGRITFQKVGSLLIDKYLANASVKAARIIYVTDKAVDYKAMNKIANKNYEITETLNHIMSNINLDCNACKLKEICDEVEGMKELHFKNSMG